jgi:hypothetical protein
MLAAPAGYFKYQSLRWQYAPQYFEDRLAVASDMIQAWIGFFGHPGNQQAINHTKGDMGRRAADAKTGSRWRQGYSDGARI